jgi:hypothetical protein
MITHWLDMGGGWRPLIANERPLREEGATRRLLGSRQVHRWWQNELALTAMPCFRLTSDTAGAANGAADGGGKANTYFTLFSIYDRMHRPQ